MATKWEYTTAIIDVSAWREVATGESFNELVENLGRKGWELIITVPTPQEPALFGFQETYLSWFVRGSTQLGLFHPIPARSDASVLSCEFVV